MKNKLYLLKTSLLYMVSSISTKVICIILILILPLNIFAIILSSMALENVVQQTKNSVSNITQNYLSDTEERMKHTVSLLYSMKANQSYGIIVSEQKGDYEYSRARYNLYTNIRSMLALSQTADGAFIYMLDIDDLLQWNLNTKYHTLENMSYYIRSKTEASLERGWQFVEVPGKEYGSDEKENFPMLWLITEQNNIYCGGWIELSSVAEKLRDDLQYEYIDITFTEDNKTKSTVDKMIISTYLDKADIYMTVTLDNQEINSSILSVYLMVKNIAIFALMLLPFLYYLLYRLLIKPIWDINKAHKALELGNSEYRINKKASSIEYRDAYASFNKMAENIKNLKLENYERMLEKQEVELRNLQLQIRPHFLINAFNLIYNLAQENDVSHIQDIILYLSDYFRYIFRSNHKCELFEKEQGLIEGYIKMAKLRYPGSIAIVYDYDPEIAFIRVPPLLIHNFIENIIKHVVKQGTVTHIMMFGRYDSGAITFQIVDDGPGVSKEKVAQINNNMKNPKITGENVGMSNAYRRLKQIYGRKADIIFQSEIDTGTTVIITFPYSLEAEDEENIYGGQRLD